MTFVFVFSLIFIDPSKTPVITQRRIIVQNPDGTTKVILQNVVQASQQVRIDILEKIILQTLIIIRSNRF